MLIYEYVAYILYICILSYIYSYTNPGIVFDLSSIALQFNSLHIVGKNW